MSFGLTFTNNSDVVTLDSEFSRLVILSRGTFSGGASFSPAITSPEPPLVFVRPSGSMTFQYVTISGSPGNWTGFSYIGGGSGQYFAAAFYSRELAKFGLRLWDGDSKILFDSGTPCAQFTRTITSWGYLGAQGAGQGLTRQSWTAYTPLDSGDYMLINNIGPDLCGSSTFSKLYCTWDYGNNRVVPFIIGIGDYTTAGFALPIVFAKPFV